MAFKQERLKSGLIHHSDRGSQYASHACRTLLERFGMKASMSRRGNCYDNAPTESFWASLKKEQLHHQHYQTRDETRVDIFDYIECFYNTIRKHSALGSLSPLDFTQSFVSDLEKIKFDLSYLSPFHGVRFFEPLRTSLDKAFLARFNVLAYYLSNRSQIDRFHGAPATRIGPTRCI